MEREASSQTQEVLIYEKARSRRSDGGGELVWWYQYAQGPASD